MSLRRILPLVALTLVACGGDATGPTTLSGSWHYTAFSLVTSAGQGCNISGVTLSLTQTGSTFSGTSSGGLAECSASIGLPTQLPTLAVNGTIDGTSVSFDLGSANWRNSGTLSGNSISGTAVLRATQQDTLRGSFSLVKD